MIIFHFYLLRITFHLLNKHFRYFMLDYLNLKLNCKCKFLLLILHWNSGLMELWTAITPDCGVRSQRGLNQSCSPRWDLFNAVLHSQFRCQEEVDSRLLVAGSQIASLTPGFSFAHNLGCRCPNGQCEAIFDIYVLRPFQWHQEHLNARCFGPFCRALNIWESQRTPNLQLFQVLSFTPTLGQSGVATRES